MKISRLSLLLVIVTIAAAPSAAQNPAGKGISTESNIRTLLIATGDESDVADIRPLIEEHNRKMVEAFKRGDLMAVSRFYADDATIFSYRGEKVRGREAIDKYWTSIKGGKDWKLEVIEIGGDKETVYQIGRSTLTTEREGRQSIYACDFVVIWKRQKDGAYRIHVDIYN